jgi:hypothetical protein
MFDAIVMDDVGLCRLMRDLKSPTIDYHKGVRRMSWSDMDHEAEILIHDDGTYSWSFSDTAQNYTGGMRHYEPPISNDFLVYLESHFSLMPNL